MEVILRNRYKSNIWYGAIKHIISRLILIMFRKEDTGHVKHLSDLISRATDETLTSDNWLYNLDVCDAVSSDPENAPRQAIRLMEQRLTSKDANIVLRSLTLLVGLAENCGSRMLQEIASSSFLENALVKRMGEKKLHKTVKKKIVEVLQQLKESFKNDPSLGPINIAYQEVTVEYPQYLPRNSEAPLKPAKDFNDAQEESNEDEALRRAISLSLQEYEREQNLKKVDTSKLEDPDASQRSSSNKHENSQEAKTENSRLASRTVSTISKVRALYDLISYEPDELSLRRGDIITVLGSVYRDWWRGSLPDGRTGIFPLNYVVPVVTKTPEDLAKEAEEEGRIFYNERKKIDKLLALLSSNIETIDEDEVNRLYGEVVPYRLFLAQLVDKYGTRKDELYTSTSQLNKELRLYDNLMNVSMGQRMSQHPFIPQTTSEPPTSIIEPQHKWFTNRDEITSQPTSNGFGNASFGKKPFPVISFTSNDQTNEARFLEPSSERSSFSNVNKFPDVSRL